MLDSIRRRRRARRRGKTLCGSLFLLFLLCGCAPMASVPALVDGAPVGPMKPREQRVAHSAGEAPALATLAMEALPTAVRVYTSTITLSTYPIERYQKAIVDPVFSWPYHAFDFARFQEEAPQPEPRTYRTLILENGLIRLTIVPELGGRILQAEHLASGRKMFFQNDVVKPTAWGPPEQRGWIAVGGLEWCLPVIEHGYDWGEPWEDTILQADAGYGAVRLSTPEDGRKLNAAVVVSLSAQSAAFTVQTTISNLADAPLRFDYWQNAMLAPGDGHRVTEGLHFVFPTDSMRVHSTADPRLPAAGQRMAWPRYRGHNFSRLSAWRQYAGLFEWPAAHGPFVGVYDTIQDTGAVRTFPERVAIGSKLFALGGSAPLDPALYTDGDGAYVEIHGGLAPTFAQQTSLGPGESLAWSEDWYPVLGIGDMQAASRELALSIGNDGEARVANIYPVHDLSGTVSLQTEEGIDHTAEVTARAGTPIAVQFPALRADSRITGVRVDGSDGRALLESVLEY